MKLSRLIEHAKVNIGQSAPQNKEDFSKEGNPFIRASSLKKLIEGVPPDKLEIISDEVAEMKRLKLYPINSVVFAKSGMSATKNRVYKLVKPCYVVSHLAILIPNEKTNPDYLKLVVKYKKPSTLIKDSAYPSIGKSDIEKFKLPFPALKDQIIIADILTRVESLVSKRRESIRILDCLLYSAFIEMFGDPVKNDKNWDELSMSKVVTKIVSGTSYKGSEKKELADDDLGVLKISAVTKGTFNPSEYKTVNKSVIHKKIINVEKGMFLFSRANTKELVAACCIVPNDYPKLFLPDKLWILTMDRDMVNLQYMNYLFKNNKYRNLLRKKASGGHDSMLNISMQKFRKLAIPKPPLPIQNKFANIVKRIELIKSKYLNHLVELENLNDTLSQQAFKGELDLSKVRLKKQNPIENLPTEETELPAADNAINEAKAYSRDELIKIIKSCSSYSKDEFSFDMLMNKINHSFEETPSYDKIKKQIYEMLNEESLIQKYNNEEKEMILRIR